MYLQFLDVIAPSPVDEIRYAFSSDWTFPAAAVLIAVTVILLIIHRIRNK